MRLGKYTVTALYDGAIHINSMLMKGRPQAMIARQLKLARQPLEIQTSVNAFLLNDGKHVTLIDTGASNELSTDLGKLRESMLLSGYKPEDIQSILLTHLHPDHIGGLLVNGQMAFPNAEIYLPQSEAGYWLSPERSKSQLPIFQGMIKALEPYQEAGKVHFFEPNSELVSGIQAVALEGHSPGHTGYRIRAGTESLLIWGDIVHNAAAQFGDPNISLEFDFDQKKARLMRLKVFKEVSASGEWIAGTHLPFPGIGRIQATGKTSYRWLPIEYAQAMSEPNRRQPVNGK